MQWMEIIKVQTASRKAERDCRYSLTSFEPIKDVSGLVSVKRYDNAAIDGWHILILNWSSAHPELQGSDMARTLLNELKRFGMVDHSVWIAPISKK